jgi:group I intron endonuclease
MAILPRIDAYGVVYLIRNTVSGGVYVGQTIQDYRIRWRRHRDDLTRGVHDNPHLQRSWNKYGADAFAVEVVEVVSDQGALDEAEQRWIVDLRAKGIKVYNQKIGGKFGGALTEETRRKISEAGKGRVVSTETRRKLSEAKQGRANILTPDGRASIQEAAKRPRTDEHKRKISAGSKGRIVSEETRQKLRDRRHSEATKQRMSQSQKGRTFTEETRRKMREAWARRNTYVLRDGNGIEYVTHDLKAFCTEHGLSFHSISDVARGRKKSIKGWTCKRQ